MNIRCYITLKKQEPNPSLQRGSQAFRLPALHRASKKKILTKGYINNFINFESIFLENG